MLRRLLSLLTRRQADRSWESEDSLHQTLLDGPEWVEEALAAEIPDFPLAIRSIAKALRTFIASLHDNSYPPHGLSAAISQATNDFVDVLQDASRGRGRSAIMSSRSLFELLTTVLDLLHDRGLEERYMNHRWVIAHLEASLRLESEYLPKKDRAAELHRQKKLLNDTRAQFVRVMEMYGSQFTRGWASEDLRTRALRHGLEAEYDFYRLGSAVLHGSSGGSIGIQRDYGEKSVHRTGPALALCPLALLIALRLFDRLLRACGSMPGVIGTEDLARRVRKGLKVWPRYRRAVMRIDSYLWPDAPPPRLLAVLVLRSAKDHGRWYLYDAQARLAVAAEPPSEIPAATAGRLEDSRRRFDQAWNGDPKGLSIAVLDATVKPVREADWVPADSVLPLVYGPKRFIPVPVD